MIRSSVRREAVKTKKSTLNPVTPQKNKKFYQTFFLLDTQGVEHQVCGNFFFTVLQVNRFRCASALKSMQSNPGATDNRGHSSSVNKTHDNDIKFLKEFINKFSKYESHYGCSVNKKLYLSPSLNQIKMYREYKLICDFQGRKSVSESKFRDIFNYEFNLSFKSLKKDTCKVCDQFQMIMKCCTSQQQQNEQIEREKQLHHKKVLEVKNQFDADVLYSKTDENKTACITFDLQKTLPTPSLSTNVAYYKRQLWTYNLCIYDEVSKTAYMYV